MVVDRVTVENGTARIDTVIPGPKEDGQLRARRSESVEPQYSRRDRFLLGGDSSVNHQLRPGHEGRFVRRQVQDAVCNLVGGAGSAHRCSRLDLLEPFRFLESPIGHGGIGETWMHGINPDVLFGVLNSGRLGE